MLISRNDVPIIKLQVELIRLDLIPCFDLFPPSIREERERGEKEKREKEKIPIRG